MHAVIVSEFGGPEVLTEAELPDLTPRPGEVTIDVTHAAVGLVDTLFRRGDLKDAPGELGKKPPFVPGLEVVGKIRALGTGVHDFRIGEPVVTLTRIAQGGYATVAVADASVTVSLDGHDGEPVQVVAALPNATTAHLSLSLVAHLRPGESILVHGAAGGLAAVYPPVARSLGASSVLGTVGTPTKIAASRSLGYDEVYPSEQFPAALGERHVDVIVDPVGGPQRTTSLAALSVLGRLLAVGHASSVPETPVAANDLWFNNQAVLGFNVGAYLQTRPPAARAAASAALALIASGQLKLPVEVLPLKDAAEAHRRLEHRAVAGRIVLAMPGQE